MAYITTNTDVACNITVTKTVVGQVLPGYPKTYSLLDAFADQLEISENTWQKMDFDAQIARIEDFKDYIDQIEQMDVEDAQTNDHFRPSSETPNEIAEI
jgi:hypothetical protein